MVRLLPVSIPPWFDFAVHSRALWKLYDVRFNPTLVRFCRASAIEPLHSASVFQSHLGSILPK